MTLTTTITSCLAHRGDERELVVTGSAGGEVYTIDGSREESCEHEEKWSRSALIDVGRSARVERTFRDADEYVDRVKETS